jgi:hypothetical protein
MQIKSLTLQHFGKFHDRVILLEPGVNLFYGENEAGKSTIHTFIGAMLFGFREEQRQGGRGDLYSKYEPWDSPLQYAGMMEIETGGRCYRLERNFQKDMRQFRVIDVETDTPLSPKEVERLYAQLDANRFMNTISISQLGSETDRSLAAALKDYAADLVQTKSTEMNLQTAMENLQMQKDEQKAKMAGLDAAALKQELLDIEVERKAIREEAERLQWETASKNEERTETLKELDALQKVEQTQNDTIAKMQATLQIVKEKEETVTKKLDKAKDDAKTYTDLVTKCANKLEEIDVINEIDLAAKQKQINRIHILPWVLILVSVAMLGGGIVAFFGGVEQIICMILAIAAILLLAGVIVYMLITGYQRQLQRDKLEQAQTVMEEKKEADRKMERSNGDVVRYTKELELVRQELQELTVVEIDTQLTEKIQQRNNDIVKQSMEIQNLQWKLEQQQDKQTQLNTRQAEVEEKQGVLDAAQEELNALEQAMENIREITRSIRTQFDEQLNASASQYFERFTKGKYKKLSIDSELNILVHTKGKKVTPDKLSQGTIQQIYLALRLAAAQVLFDEKQPMLLDDTFAHYDNARLENTLETLTEDGQQLLIFSCHTREKVIADKAGLHYNLIRL